MSGRRVSGASQLVYMVPKHVEACFASDSHVALVERHANTNLLTVQACD